MTKDTQLGWFTTRACWSDMCARCGASCWRCNGKQERSALSLLSGTLFGAANHVNKMHQWVLMKPRPLPTPLAPLEVSLGSLLAHWDARNGI